MFTQVPFGSIAFMLLAFGKQNKTAEKKCNENWILNKIWEANKHTGYVHPDTRGGTWKMFGDSVWCVRLTYENQIEFNSTLQYTTRRTVDTDFNK